MGVNLCTWLLRKLELITVKISKFNIKNGEEFFKKVDGTKLDEGFILATMDYDSMFTNISFGKTKTIIRKYYHFIAEETSVPVDVFLKALSFYIEVDAYFLFNGKILRQCKGLAMGNKLSKILAEIFVSEKLNEIMDKTSTEIVSFLSIFVDDIGCSVQRDRIDTFKDTIMKHCGMNLKLETENDEHSITYMNMAIHRYPEEGNILRMNWWQKPQFSNKILDYHSFHPFYMKKNIVTDYVKNAFRVSSQCFWDMTAEKLTEVLRNSNYPMRMVRKIIVNVRQQIGTEKLSSEVGEIDESIMPNLQETTELMKTKEGLDLVYISIPYLPSVRNSVKSILEEIKLNDVVIAPKILCNNRFNLHSNTKDKLQLSNVINASFKIICDRCDYEFETRTNVLDVERTFSHLKLNELSSPFMHVAQHPSHILSVEKSSVRRYRSRSDLNYADRV